MQNFTYRSLAVVASLFLCACAAESESVPSTPEIQRVQLSQLSAGGGIAGYDFYADIGGVRTRIGALLVVEDADNPAAGYEEETEYWRFDPAALDELATGGLSDIDIHYNGTWWWYSPYLANAFETGTEDFTAWQVNRLFNLGEDPVVVWNRPNEGHVLYTMEGRRWRKADGGYITYYLEYDFNNGEDWPEMTWYIDYTDFEIWQANRGDSPRIYEVRLTHDTDLRQTSVGVGYELKTIK